MRQPPLNLRQRRLQPEAMDQPGLDAVEHHTALRDLARVNWVSSSGGILWPPIERLLRRRLKAGDLRPLRILDVAAGGGDVPINLWHRARKKGYPVEVAGCDFNPLAIEHAKNLAAKKQAAVSFFQHDVLTSPLPPFDVITCSLFLHHFDDAQAILALGNMRQAATELALVNDLERSRVGWIVAFFGTRILARSKMAQADGVLSVEGAFTPREALALARHAGWLGAKVEQRFPFRYLLEWSRS